MLPLTLKISGLYSYQQEQIIDFQELTEAGLFGIFGSVGSGKSTILEAIGFVLYGETDRLNKTEKRGYNMLNLKSNEAKIVFEFLNFEQKKFKFTAEWRREKAYDKVTSVERSAYEWLTDQWIPLESVDASPIIGLTYDNFRRTIIIPQGKFKEFLDLKGKERSEMMKEIFHLEKFDLSRKVSYLQKENNSKIDVLDGTLATFESVSKEYIQLLNNDLEAVVLDSHQKKIELEKLEVEFKVLEKSKVDFEELTKRTLIFQELSRLKPEMDDLKIETDRFEKTEKQFKPILNTHSTLKFDNLNLNKSVSEKENKRLNIEKNRLEINQSIVEIERKYLNLDIDKKKVLELGIILKIKENKLNIKTLKQEIAVHQLNFQANEENEIKFKLELETLLDTLKSVKKNRVDTSVFMAIGEWYVLQETIQIKLGKNNLSQISIKNEIDLLSNSFSTLKLDVLNWENVLDNQKNDFDNQLIILKEEKSKLQVNEKIALFSNQLEEGENCPLCGSIEHPLVIQMEDLSEKLIQINIQIQAIENEIKAIDIKKLEAQKIVFQLTQVTKTLHEEIENNTVFRSEMERHLSEFIWEDFLPSDNSKFIEKKKNVQEVEETIKRIESQAEEWRNKLIQSSDLFKNNQIKLNSLNIQVSAMEGVLMNDEGLLNTLILKDFEEKTVTEIQSDKNQLEKENLSIEHTHKSKSEELHKVKEEIASLDGSLSEIKLSLTSSNENILKIEKEISILLKEFSFESLAPLVEYLDIKRDIEEEKLKLEKFNIELKTAEALFLELKNINIDFNPDLFTKKQTEFAAYKSLHEVSLAKVATQTSELTRLEIEYQKKERFLLQHEKLKDRQANLSVLGNMFNANGFVNYVSSIYLKNLADVSNTRFHRMTKNQLSLKINASNEFEIIDYLNNGASRSVKTLSGGQGFQASLCLALSLAESVQSLNKSGKNFFFIDEGFGTQDSESIAVVFETLQSLNKEGRIVGIISHVNELQEQIPKSIHVVKDDETGSLIVENWK